MIIKSRSWSGRRNRVLNSIELIKHHYSFSWQFQNNDFGKSTATLIIVVRYNLFSKQSAETLFWVPITNSQPAALHFSSDTLCHSTCSSAHPNSLTSDLKCTASLLLTFWDQETYIISVYTGFHIKYKMSLINNPCAAKEWVWIKLALLIE